MSDIFISYANEDCMRAKILADALEARASLCDGIGGQSYDKAIEHELDTAESVITLWSKHSVISEWVKNEAQVAVERSGEGLFQRLSIMSGHPSNSSVSKPDLIGWDGDLRYAGFEALQRGIFSASGPELRILILANNNPNRRSYFS